MTHLDPYADPPQRPQFDTPNARPTPQPTMWGWAVQAALLLFGAALCLRIGWMFFTKTPANDLTAANPPVSTATDKASTPISDRYIQDSRTTTRAGAEFIPSGSSGIDRATLDLAKANQREYLNDAGKLRRLLDEWRVATDEWQQYVESLLTSDAGKLLTVDPVIIKGFRAIHDQERPPGPTH